MSAERWYEVPEQWGGGRARGVQMSFHGLPTEYVALTRADSSVMGIIHRDELTEIKPALPDEPRNFATVRVGVRSYTRDDSVATASWYGPDGPYAWADLCERSDRETGFPPVLLEPVSDKRAAEPVELPWTGRSYGGRSLAVAVHNSDQVRVKIDNRTANVELLVAREMAAAINWAIDSLEAAASEGGDCGCV